MPVCQERLNRKTKCHNASGGRGMCVRICQQVRPPWLRGLISSNMFLTHAEGSSAQIISPSAVKSFQFSTPHLWGITPLPLPLWINVSSATFERITDPAPSFFGYRLTEYFPHLYSIISILLFSPLSVSHFPRHQREAHSWTADEPISFSTPARAPLIMRHQERPANPNLPSIVTSPVKSGVFICLQNSTAKDSKGVGIAVIKRLPQLKDTQPKY